VTDILPNHELVPDYQFSQIGYRTRPVLDRQGKAVEGLHQIWISLENEKQLNSYTTAAVKELILAFRRASCDRRCVAVVLTGAGTRAFCTGGNTEEYTRHYAGRPAEYLQYMRLFNDLVTSILVCDKPVICRVNGLRIGGGQEIGMACDFSVAGDHAAFGQAGPVHGSAPDGGSTDFLHLYVGYGHAAESLVLCEQWPAHKALRLGLINDLAPVYKESSGTFITNPLVTTDRLADELGRPALGEWKSGAAREAAQAQIARCQIDFAELDQAVDRLATKLLYLFPDCTRKTLESLRKKKLEHWNQNSETSRSWLSLNMNTEASAGFPAFQYGERPEREIDFVLLRKRIAEGRPFDHDLVAEVLPAKARERWLAAQAAERGARHG